MAYDLPFSEITCFVIKVLTEHCRFISNEYYNIKRYDYFTSCCAGSHFREGGEGKGLRGGGSGEALAELSYQNGNIIVFSGVHCDQFYLTNMKELDP